MPESSHRLRRMSGRDPHERHRPATSLELLFDLTFVVAFGAAGNELAHGLAEDHVTSGLMYAVSMRAADPFHLTLLAGTAAVVVALAPVVTIAGNEAIGHRHLQDHLSKLRA